MAKIKKQRSRMFSAKPPAPIVNIAEKRSKREALQKDRKPSVFIAVPTLSGDVNYTIAMLFNKAGESNGVPECPYRFQCYIEADKKGIDYARNLIVQRFLNETDADWLMMIDADQLVPENFWHLITVKDADVVSALTPVWVGNMDPEAMYRINIYGVDSEHRCYNLPIPDRKVTQPYRVPVVGTGCLAIRRRVFAPAPAGVGSIPFEFTRMEDQKVKAGEDVNFSVKVNRAGFVIAAHPGVWFDHVKRMPLMQIAAHRDAYMNMMSEGRQTSEAQRLSVG